ncbi:DUF1254 domain-containing protein [bacterium]
MKGLLRTLGIILALAAAVHFLAVWSLPRMAMTIARRVIMNNAGGPNIAFHSKPTSEDNNIVVMQNADTLATMCAYDLAGGPVRVRAAVPDTYWSVSFYEMNTDNFYVKNDRQATGGDVEIILVAEGREKPEPGDAEVVISPTTQGIVIFRNLVRKKEEIEELMRIQKKASCEPM